MGSMTQIYLLSNNIVSDISLPAVISQQNIFSSEEASSNPGLHSLIMQTRLLDFQVHIFEALPHTDCTYLKY